MLKEGFCCILLCPNRWLRAETDTLHRCTQQETQWEQVATREISITHWEKKFFKMSC